MALGRREDGGERVVIGRGGAKGLRHGGETAGWTFRVIAQRKNP